MVYSATAVLQIAIPEYVEGAVTGAIEFVPLLVGALLILLVGWIVGRAVGGVVRRVVDRSGIDSRVAETPLGGALGGTERAVSGSLGRVAAYFVYALALLAAADTLAIELLSEWISAAVSYLPAFVAGALIIVLGFVLADFLADVVGGTEAMTDVRYTEMFADGLRVFLYSVAVIVGLDTMGVDVEILYLFAGALAGGLALGVALAIGIAFGLGGRDYVADNIGGWLPGRASPRTATGGGGSTAAGAGTDGDDGDG
jgi:small-conductance mechanosensitive channel